MKNKAEDLKNILFASLERISDPEDDTDINEEIKKAQAIANVAKQIIDLEKEATKRMKLTGGNDPNDFFEDQNQRLIAR